jgi:type II secretory pathway pseudopilin PulG
MGRQTGFVLPAVMALVAVLLATGLAFMRWSSDEALQSRETTGAMQAYYLAQMGIVEEGFTYLRSLQESSLPIGETILPGREVTGVGRYANILIFFLPSTAGGDFWSQERRYRISCIGTVQVPYFSNGQAGFKDVKRKAVLYVEVRSFADYMYLTNEEMTNFGDRIKFWHGDTLDGRVHSNSEIAIMQDPVFTDLVSTTEDDFWRGSPYNPQFLGPDPMFNVPEVMIPNTAENLRAGAAAQGHFYSYPDKSYFAHFTPGQVRISMWDTGAPMDTMTNTWTLPVAARTCIFFTGPLDVYGIVAGEVTIGSSETVRIVDNIMYPDVNNRGRWISPNARHDNFLGIVSEADVKVANTKANGRNNSSGRGNFQTNQDSTSCVITAAIVALGQSFTFEQQNDPDSGYVCVVPCGCSPTGGGPGPDDRGYLYILGSITQMRRGYVHRSTCQSTGYLKSYHYDQRLRNHRPPCFFSVKDESGRALFNIVQWGQAIEWAPEVQHFNVVRYN